MRMFAVLLTLLCLLLPTHAPAEEMSMPESLLGQGDSLWALTWQGVHRQTEDGWQLILNTQVEGGVEEYISYARMWVDEKAVYLLGQATSADGSENSWIIDRSLRLAGGEMDELVRLCDIQWSAGESGWISFHGFAVEGNDALILLYDESSGAPWGCNTLYRVSLSDGAAAAVVTDYLAEITPWKDGLYLASWQQGPKPVIVCVNPVTGLVEGLAEMPTADCGGLAYNPAEDATYVCDSSSLYRFDSTFTQPQRTGYLLPSDSGRMGMAAAVCGGRYYIADWQSQDELTSCTIDPAGLPTRTLRLSGVWAVNDIVRAFAQEHPDIAIEYADDPFGVEAVLAHMQGSDAADIYGFSPSDDAFAPLLEKGYLAPLDSQALTDLVKRMYPALTDHALSGDQLIGLPVSMSTSVMGYYPGTLDMLGLTEADLPTSIEGLMDFILRWEEEIRPEWGDLQLFEYAWDLRTQLFTQILSQQLLISASEGGPLTFDTPEVRRLLARLEEISPVLESMNAPAQEGDLIAYFGEDAPAALFTDYADPLPTAYTAWDGAARPWPLSLTDGGDALIAGSTTMLCLSRYSENADAALEFLEYVAANLPPEFLAAALPEWRDPIEQVYYEQQSASLRQSLDHYRVAVNDPTADQAALRDIIATLEAQLASVEEDRWAFTEEDLAAYRALAPRIILPAASMFTGNVEDLQTLMQRYLDREISAEQLIREFDRLIRMMQAE